MFGYVRINRAEMKFKEYDVYRSYYCGLCKTLKGKYGSISQMTLTYDLTFLSILLTGLYEPKTDIENRRCMLHPFQKIFTRINEYSEYAADMTILLTYYKCQDDWEDERKLTALCSLKLLGSKYKKAKEKHQDKLEKIYRLLEELSKKEKAPNLNLDIMASYFGNIMGEIFQYKDDIWGANLFQMGFYLGKFIYIMDAYEDIEEDIKKDIYNPLKELYNTKEFEEKAKKILTMMIGECSKEFEKLPILENVEILRNILYSGVWARYEDMQRKREESKVKRDV